MPSIKEFGYSDILGWSSSRFDMFRTCRRQYFYHYYAKFDRDIAIDKLKQLKALTSVPLEVGSLTHECIATLLKRLRQRPGEPVDHARLAGFISTQARSAIAAKRFSEVYYGELKSINADELASETQAALESLLRSERYRWILETASKARADWLIEPHGYGETRVAGLKAYCRVDFLFPVEGLLYIMDWKTGKERAEKHASQIVGYAAWAAYHFGKPIDEIRPTVAYLLPEYRETTQQLRQDEMSTFEATVRSQTEEMYALCSDIPKNMPKPKDAFLTTKIEAICPYCNYRELCARI